MKRTALLVLILAAAYVAATTLLWPMHQSFLPNAQPQASALDFSHISAQAPLSLIVGPDDGVASVTQAIASAQKSVDLVVYELEDTNVEQALVAAQTRGVKVRVLLDDLDTFGTHPNDAAFNYLNAQGVPVEWSPSYFALTRSEE